MIRLSRADGRSRLLLVSGIVLLGLALRLSHLGTDPLWYDEICSLQGSTGFGYQALILPANQLVDPLQDTVHLSSARSIREIWASAMDHDTHPPLYFIFLRLWRELLGTSETSVRLPGVIASVVGIGSLAAVGTELFGFTAGCWAATLMAVSAPQIYFTHETRSYSVFPTFCLFAAYALLRIERAGRNDSDTSRIPKRWPILLGLSTLLAMLTHYYSALPLLAMGGYALLALRRAPRRWAVGSMVVAGILFLVLWGPHLLAQRSIFTLNKVGADRRDSLETSWVIEHLPLAAVRQLLGTDITSPQAALAIAVLVGAGELIALGVAFRRKDAHLLFCHAWMLISLGTLGFLDYRRQTGYLSLLRYTLPAATGLFLLIARMARSGRWGRHLFPAAAVCICLMGWPNAYASWKGDWRQYAHDLDSARKPDDCFVFLARNRVYMDSGAFITQYYAKDFRGPAVFLVEPAGAQLLKQLARFPTVWFIAEPGFSPEQERACLPLTGYAELHSYAGVGDVWRIVRGQPR